MLIEKEVIAPGKYWYMDEKTGQPKVLDVDANLINHWHSEGSKMLSAGLQVPVPYEHDFSAHPMTPKDKLLGNAGEVKEYKLKDFNDPHRGKVKNALFAVVDVQDPDVKNKIGRSVRWTSPWFNSFTDGDGRSWNNVIAHLALTTRPRITKQSPFPNTTAALSMAVPTSVQESLPQGGYCLSKAGLLSDKSEPQYPIAFSMFSGAALGEFPPAKEKSDPAKKKSAAPAPSKDKASPPKGGEGEESTPAEGAEGGKPAMPSDGDPTNDNTVDLPPLGDQAGDVSMSEVLCDLLRALGVNCEHSGDEGQFKRNLYTAAMQKVHELTTKGMNKDEEVKPGSINKDKPPGSQLGAPNGQVQQEQQPMYMSHTMNTMLSLEEINKLPDPIKSIALSMRAENEKLRAEMESAKKTTDSLRDGKIKEEQEKRNARVALLTRISPKIKGDLEAMIASESMALSLGDNGTVIDPMANTLSMLEKQLSGLPELLRSDSTALAVQPHPTDDNDMTEEASDKLADDFSRRMGVPPTQKKVS